MRYLIKILIISCIFMISGCSAQEKVNLDVSMSRVIDYKLYEVGAEQSDDINKWLTNARLTGEEGQYFILQDASEGEEYMYSYVYRKGYSDYEVSFIYEPSEKGTIHIVGINNNPKNENIVEIKSINDLSILFVLSDESLESKLNLK